MIVLTGPLWSEVARYADSRSRPAAVPLDSPPRPHLRSPNQLQLHASSISSDRSCGLLLRSSAWATEGAAGDIVEIDDSSRKAKRSEAVRPGHDVLQSRMDGTGHVAVPYLRCLTAGEADGLGIAYGERARRTARYFLRLVRANQLDGGQKPSRLLGCDNAVARSPDASQRAVLRRCPRG